MSEHVPIPEDLRERYARLKVHNCHDVFCAIRRDTLLIERISRAEHANKALVEALEEAMKFCGENDPLYRNPHLKWVRLAVDALALARQVKEG